MTDGSGTDLGGLLWVIGLGLGTLLLGAVLAYGGTQTLKRRGRTGAPVDARTATPGEAAAAGGEHRSSTSYLLRLGIPIAAAVALILIITALYI